MKVVQEPEAGHFSRSKFISQEGLGAEDVKREQVEIDHLEIVVDEKLYDSLVAFGKALIL